LKQTAIERVRKELEAIRSISPTAEVCVVAHSFGSYIIGNLLHSGEQFKAIAFTGSVLPSKFDFSAAGGTPIVNEVACSDVWPVLAQKIGWGYGATGTFGFNRGSVIDRVHHGFGHSNALTSEFCTRFWVPFFCSNRVEPSDFDHVRNSLSVRILDRIPIWLLAIGVIVACSCGLLFRIVSVLMSHFL
jgi:hypothetical protein